MTSCSSSVSTSRSIGSLLFFFFFSLSLSSIGTGDDGLVTALLFEGGAAGFLDVFFSVTALGLVLVLAIGLVAAGLAVAGLGLALALVASSLLLLVGFFAGFLDPAFAPKNEARVACFDMLCIYICWYVGGLVGGSE